MTYEQVAATAKVTKNCAGCYTVSTQGLKVSVENIEGFGGWIARALFDAYTVSNPLPTKKQAVECAYYFIADRLNHA